MNQQNKERIKKNRHMETENKLPVAREVKRIETQTVSNKISHGDAICIIENTVNGTVISLNSDRV